MIRHILDTNAVIALISTKSDCLLRRIFDSAPASLAVSSIVVHELYDGAYKSSRVEHNLETLRLLLADFAVLDIDENDAVVSGAIRASLAMKGTPIGPYDILIAGQAKARHLVLVTNNIKEFERVDGLAIEDWTK